ncbi:MAG: cupredoxin domain-containing protein [Chloroflexi bacterium]|nr:cupredoxin domain-containing protein [Chloroflexota bacterium]
MFKRFVPVVMLAGLVFLVAAACSSDPEPVATPARSSPATIPPVPAASTATETDSETNGQTDDQEGTPIAVSLQDPGGTGEYRFGPSEFTFSVGETVTFTLSSDTEFHTFTVTNDEIDIDVDVDSGATETVTFTFDQAGTFQLICIPHERLGMVGTITVR